MTYKKTELISQLKKKKKSIDLEIIQAYLRDIAGSVPDYHNKANIAIKRLTQFFWFPSAYKIYVYTIL